MKERREGGSEKKVMYQIHYVHEIKEKHQIK